jgi:hypothetical protein
MHKEEEAVDKVAEDPSVNRTEEISHKEERLQEEVKATHLHRAHLKANSRCSSSKLHQETLAKSFQ